MSVIHVPQNSREKNLMMSDNRQNRYSGILINRSWHCDMFNRRTVKEVIHQRRRETSKPMGAFFSVAPATEVGYKGEKKSDQMQGRRDGQRITHEH